MNRALGINKAPRRTEHLNTQFLQVQLEMTKISHALHYFIFFGFEETPFFGKRTLWVQVNK